MLLTNRDREIMIFINDFGFCEMPQLEKKFGLRKPRGYKVIKRLIEAGLVMHEYVLRHKHGIYRLTKEGAQCTDLPMLKYLSLGSYLHQLMVVNVHLELTRRYPEAVWLSERRLKREIFLEKGFYRSGHIADGMLVFPDEKRIAIEVELTMKGKDRLGEILRQYDRSREIDEVWYYCAPEVVEKVKKEAAWVDSVSVFGLAEVI